MLFTLITGPTIEKARLSLREALKQGVDGVEIRIDTFSPIDLEEIQSLRNDATPIRVLMTLRPGSQGGFFSGSEEQRLDWIEKLCAFHPDFFDLEHDVPEEFRRKLAQKYPTIKLMTSYHNFEHTPSDLDALLKSIQSPFTHVYKIATMANSVIDTLRMIAFVRAHHTQLYLTGIAMGDHGLPTRVLGSAIGNFIDYAFLNHKEQTAPGQIAIDELLHIYRYRALNDRTALFGLIGSPVANSLGHLIHNAVFGQFGINAAYIKMDIIATQLGPFLTAIRKLPFQGLSVTMPLKEAVIPLLDGISAPARTIGAVNTIEVKEGKLIGHNTDGIGALDAIEEKMPVAGKKIVVIGAGGAAKALVHEAIARRAQVVVLNRTAYKAQELAKHSHCIGGGFELLPTIYAQGYDLIVNCTPDAEPIHPQLILPGCFAMDITCVPKRTPFLHHASERGCQLIYGYEMFINQAVEQQIIWFKQKQEKAVIKKTFEEIVLDKFAS